MHLPIRNSCMAMKAMQLKTDKEIDAFRKNAVDFAFEHLPDWFVIHLCFLFHVHVYVCEIM